MGTNQHYVPQFYLRGFADEENPRGISLYKISDGTFVKRASIKHQASRKSYYGKDGEMESTLGLLEGEASRVIQRIRTYSRMPRQYSLDHQALLAYILLQRKRTPQAEKDFLDSINKPLAVAFRDDPRFSGVGKEWYIAPEESAAAVAVDWSLWLWPVLLDLKCALLRTNRCPGFITSDSPVIYYNRFLENLRTHACNTRLMSCGLMVFLPISPSLLALLYDASAYRIRRGRSRIRISLARDVDELNRLQLASADDIAYSDSSVDPGYLATLVETVQELRSTRQVEVKEFHSVSSKHHSLIQIRSPENRLGLSLSFMQIRRKAMRRLDLSNEAVFRDSQMWDLMDEFLKSVEDGKRGREDLFMFLAEKGKLLRTPDSFPQYHDSTRPSSPYVENERAAG